jgi:hypothetical protein
VKRRRALLESNPPRPGPQRQVFVAGVEGIADWRLIDADECREWAQLLLPAFSFNIGLIDFPMP